MKKKQTLKEKIMLLESDNENLRSALAQEEEKRRKVELELYEKIRGLDEKHGNCEMEQKNTYESVIGIIVREIVNN